MIPDRAVLRMAALLLVVLAGCGRQPRGESLSVQYERALQVPDPEARVMQLLDVADKQHKAGDASGTAGSLISAADAAREVRDAAGRAAALNRVSMAAARRDLPSDAKTWLREVGKIAEGVDSPEARVPLLARMAYTYGKYLGDSREAADLLARAEATAGEIARPEGRSEALLQVALIHFALEQSEPIQRLAERALQDARAQEDLRKRSDALANAAAVLSRMKQAEQAEAVFQEAQQTAASITEPLSQAYAYVHLGGKLAEAGQPGPARQALQTAEDAADRVPDQSLRNPLLETIYAAQRGS